MRANVLTEVGKIECIDIDKPELKEGYVLVKVRAAGICGSDISRVYKDGAHKMPLVVGHEFAGDVLETYSIDKSMVGKRVGVFPLIPCMKCSACAASQFELCSDYDYLGSRSDGGMAEYVAVPEWNVIELHDNISYESAAMLEPMCVAVHAIRRVGLSNYKDSNVLIYGLGTIGLLMVMILKRAGFKNVYAVGNKDFQKQLAVSMGLEEENYIDGLNNNVIRNAKELVSGRNYDYVFECVGISDTIDNSISLAARAGKVMLIGNPNTDIKFNKDTYWKILRNQLTLMGSWNSSYTKNVMDDWHYCLDKLHKGIYDPTVLITHRFSPENLCEGFKIMRDKKECYCKVMMIAD